MATEMDTSRACASKQVSRSRNHGELGLLDCSSTPHRQPTGTPADVVGMVERMRHEHRCSTARIAFELNSIGVVISRRTVTQLLAQLGLNRRQFIDPPLASRTEQRSPSIAECKEPRSPLLGLGMSGGAAWSKSRLWARQLQPSGMRPTFLTSTSTMCPGSFAVIVCGVWLV
ncbi:hypothetical protein [Streptomyces sp. NPDC005167]